MLLLLECRNGSGLVQTKFIQLQYLCATVANLRQEPSRYLYARGLFDLLGFTQISYEEILFASHALNRMQSMFVIHGQACGIS